MALHLICRSSRWFCQGREVYPTRLQCASPFLGEGTTALLREPLGNRSEFVNRRMSFVSVFVEDTTRLQNAAGGNFDNRVARARVPVYNIPQLLYFFFFFIYFIIQERTLQGSCLPAFPPARQCRLAHDPAAPYPSFLASGSSFEAPVLPTAPVRTNRRRSLSHTAQTIPRHPYPARPSPRPGGC